MHKIQETEIRDPAARASEAVEELRDMQGEKMVLIQRGSVLDCGGPPPLWSPTGRRSKAPEGWRTPKPGGGSKESMRSFAAK